MNKLNFSKFLPFLTISLVAFVAIAVATNLFPDYKKLLLITSQMNQTEEEIRQEEEYFANLAEIKQKLDQDKENISKIEDSLPNDPDMPVFLNFIQKTADRAGVMITNISPFTVNTAEISGSLREVTMSFSVTGTYEDFKDFLSYLEKSSRIVEVETISFSADPKDSSSSFGLSIKIYSY